MQELVGKYVSYMDPDENATILGLVVGVMGDSLYMRRQRPDEENLPTTHYLMAMDMLSHNPFLVDIFDSKEDADAYFTRVDEALRVADAAEAPGGKKGRSH